MKKENVFDTFIQVVFTPITQVIKSKKIATRLCAESHMSATTKNKALNGHGSIFTLVTILCNLALTARSKETFVDEVCKWANIFYDLCDDRGDELNALRKEGLRF